jgi:hypothetical protein
LVVFDCAEPGPRISPKSRPGPKRHARSCRSFTRKSRPHAGKQAGWRKFRAQG